MSAQDDLDFIAQAMPAFVSEAHEQVAEMEQLLLQLEESPNDRERLDALFRCAHTVKGSAGIFGLDEVVAFTHHMETLLDELREGHIQLNAELSSLLLACNDQILALVDETHDQGLEAPEREAQRTQLVQDLQQIIATRAPSTPGVDALQTTNHWKLLADFGRDCFRNGIDPASIVNYLGERVNITAVACDLSQIPALDVIDPETCHLCVIVAIDANQPQLAVDDAFSFVRDDCVLRLLAPHVSPKQLIELIEESPDHPRLGDLLVNVGAITESQLAEGLRNQARERNHAQHLPAPKLGEILQEKAGVPPEVVNAALQKQQRARDIHADDSQFIRIPANRLDEVINLLGELVIAAAGADMIARQSKNAELIEANQQMGHLIEEIRNGTLQLRMVPIGATFSRFRRVVRDTASELRKDVALEIVGAETELDKAVVEKIADPLMHLVRNGLDHGLEPPEERIAVGKPSQGKLVLSARHESGSIHIRISDDGRGIDRARVLQRAWERGLIEPGITPPDEKILQLIFEPGFSTAEQITNLSGRGVGMDVVRKNIEALRGTLTVSSEFGRGTDIDIYLPLTLAIIDGFLVRVGSSKFVLPLESIIEVVDSVQADESEAAGMAYDRLDHAKGRYCMPLRGELLSVVNLRDLYVLESPRPQRASVVVVQSGQYRYGVEVDQLLGQHQTVIKPMGRLFGALRGISGSSVLGNGEVALIFDVNALQQLAQQLPAAQNGRHIASQDASTLPV